MAFCEMILLFRDPVPDSLISDLLDSGVFRVAIPIFDRSFQVAADCSPSDLRYELKNRLSGTVYALANIKQGSLVINLSDDE